MKLNKFIVAKKLMNRYMKTDKREYITPVTEIVELDTLMMLAMSTSDEGLDTDSGTDDGEGDSGGWSREQVGGSWNDIWGGM